MDEDRANDAVEHLRTAVNELVAAGRAFLDALDDTVDRSRSEAGPTLSTLLDSVARGFIRPLTPTIDDDADGDDDDGDADPGGGFHHIPVE